MAFARAGFAGTSMEDVAAETGVTKLILYRHFRSKEDLYRAVLQRVSDRLAEEFRRNLGERDRAASGPRALLTVAREEPSGFVLLWRHAAREPDFAEYAAAQAELAVGAVTALLGPVDHWIARSLVAWLVDSVLAWLDDGSPERDEEFLRLVTDAARGMVRALVR